MSTERIFAAAIQGPDGSVYHSPPPARHGDVIHSIVTNLDLDCVPGDWPQGFITSRLRFVDRAEALRIAVATGTKFKRPPNGEELYTEDLF